MSGLLIDVFAAGLFIGLEVCSFIGPKLAPSTGTMTDIVVQSKVPGRYTFTYDRDGVVGRVGTLVVAS